MLNLQGASNIVLDPMLPIAQILSQHSDYNRYEASLRLDLVKNDGGSVQGIAALDLQR